jgi:hypothetical protein
MINKTIEDLLNPREKEWHAANNDLLLFSFIFEKEYNKSPKDQEMFHGMLGDELYNYKLSREEMSEIIESLKYLIDSNSSFAPTVAGVLGECNNDDIYHFLYCQLKGKYKTNSDLAISILRSLNGRTFDGFRELLINIKNDDNTDNNLKAEVNKCFSFLYS